LLIINTIKDNDKKREDIKKADNKHRKNHYIKKIKSFFKLKKLTKGIVGLILLSIILIASFIMGMLMEYNTSFITKTPINHIFKNERYEYVYYYELSVNDIEQKVFNFIKLIFNDDDPHYIDEVTQAFMKLFDEEDNKQNVLYYIALCAVESHFKMSARSSAGAVGISQIMPSVWATTIRKNYGITREELYTNTYKNIYAGFKVWDNYRRKNKGNIKLANAGYLGANSMDYQNKINYNYSILVGMIFKNIFDDDPKYTTVAIPTIEKEK